jgi:hypothetical protein
MHILANQMFKRQVAAAFSKAADPRRAELDVVGAMTAEERAMLRTVEDEFARVAAACVDLRLAYPTPATARAYEPLWEAPRYRSQVLLAWLFSARRREHGPAALAEARTDELDARGVRAIIKGFRVLGF